MDEVDSLRKKADAQMLSLSRSKVGMRDKTRQGQGSHVLFRGSSFRLHCSLCLPACGGTR